MRLSLGLFLKSQVLGDPAPVDPVPALVSTFVERVDADGGVTVATSCLTDILTYLNSI